MAKWAPGHRSSTAWARTWAVEWRSTSLPSGESAVTMETFPPSLSVVPRSTALPSILAATAAFASRGPMAAARSAAVDPAASGRAEPSGRDTTI